MIPMNALIHSRRGQTLVEALIALSILTVGFLGIVTLLAKSFQLNRTTTYDTQATYLAGEGIEVVKNLIDHDVYAGLPFGACFYDGPGYYSSIDYGTVADPVTDCSGVISYSLNKNSVPLYFDPGTESFTTTAFGNQSTVFTRSIYIGEGTNANGDVVDIDVQSTVTWTSDFVSNSITLEDHFYDWHP